MRLLNDWISENLLNALGWTLVHSVWQLILIAAALWILLKIAHRAKPSTKYGLAVGALALAFVVSMLTFAYQYEAQPSVATHIAASGDLQIFFGNSAILLSESKFESGIRLATDGIEQNIFLLVNFWFLGVLLFLFRLVNSFSEIRSLRKSSSSVVDFQIQRVAYRLANKMGVSRAVQLKISSVCISPLTFGTFKPIILLPAGLLFQLSPAQLEAIIAHELAHVKRNDYLANLLLSVMEVLFFFHPCYWWINNTVKELRENAADDLVLKSGIDPKNLATSLAEVINFAQQNPPELALAAGKKRNPTLQRIKRILGYPAQNYPQNPIISIPMLLTLFLSVGLMASAQQDAPKQTSLVAPKAPIVAIEPTFPAPDAQDTIRNSSEPKSPAPKSGIEKNRMVITDDNGNRYQIVGDLLISGGDTVVLSPNAKSSLERFKAFNAENMPHLDLPMAPVFPVDMAMAPIPAFDFGASMPVMATFPPIPPLDMAAFPMPAMDFVMPSMPAMDADFGFPFAEHFAPHVFGTDTTKMSKAEKEKWAKEWAKKAEIAAKEWEKNSEEWAAKFEKEFQPKLKEFEIKMKEWEAANGPRMKEFEQKMAAWQAAHEPKLKEFEAKMNEWHKANKPKMMDLELKMKEWEAAQKPKMEEFQRKMEIWQKEHQAKLQEFQKLIQQELKKDDNK
ncbi:Signal transducer regulating beta-lactamase production, contains metallopeptidase domain [Algoriphagus alkaliphilus]|uniref:Signal transducer regulating beta-lactamase production, contains metallopeptidase domain n=1 Tax=Algoriphagus alkaliphilus TaxID=279824 RepID=A0A1G5YBR8_9BACT|nr:M56 family metallopeptidase [Algoriphagus alkaliphilus]SDA79447.1 Signal transducer regulating beta-lactamase production, contains metallopeptidase domain [Algoriphagus alkaliphilus]